MSEVIWPHKAISASSRARKTHTHTYVCRLCMWSLDKKWKTGDWPVDVSAFIFYQKILSFFCEKPRVWTTLSVVTNLPVNRHGLVIIRTWRILDVGKVFLSSGCCCSYTITKIINIKRINEEVKIKEIVIKFKN